MAAAKSRRKKIFEAPVVNVYKVVHFCMLLLVLVNLFVVYRFESDRKPQTVVQEIHTLSNHVYVVTNVVFNFDNEFVDGSSSSDKSRTNYPTNEFGGVKVNAAEYMIDLPYHYCQVGGRAYIQIAGITFGVGDLTSYGRIDGIFPERVLLDNGYSLKNTDFETRFGLTSSQELQRRRDQMEFSQVDNVPGYVPVVPNTRGNSLNGEVFFNGSSPRLSSFSSNTNRIKQVHQQGIKRK